jgi:hypothetical protein
MSESIVRQLIIKDLRLMKIPAIAYWLSGLVAIVVVVVGGDVAGMTAIILFVAALFGTGVHSAMLTVTEERREQTLPFIMSLPITIREYTSAKLIGNMLLVGGIWLTLSAASCVVFIGEALPLGAVPFITIVLIAILLAYVIILATALIWESMTPTIVAIVAANLCTQGLLWWIASLHGIRSTIGGNAIVWNTTSITVIALQIFSIVALLAITYQLQSRKTSFI